jgi:membrane-bound lytic murein transglycosylase D
MPRIWISRNRQAAGADAARTVSPAALCGILAGILTAFLAAGCSSSRSSAGAASEPSRQSVAGEVSSPTPEAAKRPSTAKVTPDPLFLSSRVASSAASFMRLGRESMRDEAWFEATGYLDSALTHLAVLEASGELPPRQQAAAAMWRDSVREWLVEAVGQSGNFGGEPGEYADLVDPDNAERLGGSEDASVSEYIDHEIEEVSLASLEDLEALIPRLPDRSFDLPLPSPLPHSVLQAMRVFTGSGRGYFERWLQRKGRYEALINAKLDERGMPRDLLYLAMVESGFNPRAWSHASASGLWQFISATGRRYGLRDDLWEDPRRDPVRATDAALDYLEDLYAEFGDWHLAMAAYNCGEGRIRRQQRGEPGMSYWEMSLPKETRYYIPKIMAAMIIGRNPAVFGFNLAELSHGPLRFDTATVTKALPLRGVAAAVGVSEDSLRALNPALRRGTTPPGRRAYTLYLPEGTRDLFLANLEGIEPVASVSLQTHRVKRGQTLSGIAARYGVSMADIRNANAMRGVVLRIGQVLTIPVPGAEPVVRSGATVRRTAAGGSRHIVRSGETLSGIAARYRVSVSDLRRANGLRPGSILKAGRTVVVPSRGNERAGIDGRDAILLAASGEYYRVRSGDNLWAISSRFGNSVGDLKRLNEGLSEDLQPGQRIRVR